MPCEKGEEMTEIFVSKICGLCGGSKRAIDNTRELAKKEKQVVLFKEILHNKNVLKELEKQGVQVKEKLEEIKQGDFVVVRAHGEPFATFEHFDKNNIRYADCTCPNVKAINLLVKKKAEEGFKIIIVGKYGYGGKSMHPEVAGTAGWCPDPIFLEKEEEIETLCLTDKKYFLVVQTTFSRDLAEKMIELVTQKMEREGKIFEYKNTICNAQKNINIASKELALTVDAMVVIGGKNSSNTKELFVAMSEVCPSFHIENEDEILQLINQGKFVGYKKIGLTAGASTMGEDIEKIKAILEEKLN